MRRRRTVVAAAGAGVAVGLAAYAYWLLHPPHTTPGVADAVVSHAGGGGERLDRALELMDDEVAPTLVLLLGSSRSVRSAALCGQTQPYEVLCVDPEPVTTVGEGRAVARLADERGWRTVIAVTSDYHLRRAVLIDRRCTDVEIVGVASGHRRGALELMRSTAREMIALPWAALTAC